MDSFAYPYDPKDYHVILSTQELDETLTYMYYVAVKDPCLRTRAPPPHHQFIELVCDDAHPLAMACYTILFRCAPIQDPSILLSYVARLQNIMDAGTLGAELDREVHTAVSVLTDKVRMITQGVAG